VNRDTREMFLGFLSFNYSKDTFGEEYQEGRSVGMWFQKTFPDPESAEKYVRDRPPPQSWKGYEVTYHKTTTKRCGLLIGQIEKKGKGKGKK